jgi:hypothetical protein
MEPSWANGSATAQCPTCKGVTLFHNKDRSHEFGSVDRAISDPEWLAAEEERSRIAPKHQRRGREVSYLVRCAGCGRAGLAVVYGGASPTEDGELHDFWPRAYSQVVIPTDVPPDIRKEFREAELCASVKAYRGGAALLRSTLERALKGSGYAGVLDSMIEGAFNDGLISESRKEQAHHRLRVLRNDIVHDERVDVTPAEFEDARKYALWMLNDLYEDRTTVERQLKAKNRPYVPHTPAPVTPTI